MGELSNLVVQDSIGVITIDSPPVNALGAAVRQALVDRIDAANGNPAIEAIVLLCAGRTFFAGADITEFGKPFAPPGLNDVMAKLESNPKLIVAAIHGTALGGGLETALACDYRIAVPSARLGLPEVALGILPGAGGTQRLPRLIGAEAALDMIVSGKPVGAEAAIGLGLIDELAREGALREDAVAFAMRLLEQGMPRRKLRDQDEKIVEARGKPALFSDFAARNARAFKGLPAPAAIVEAVRAAVDLPFDEGLAREAELVNGLMETTESKALRHAFFAEREAGKIPDVPATTPVRPVRSVAVIGAGTMGGGITMNFLNAGLPVTIVEMRQDALDRGIAAIRKNYETSARKGRLRPADVEARMALVTSSLGLEAVNDADLIIEAVFEQMAVKKDIFARLDKIAKPDAILASNTSFLDLDEIASVTRRPESVIGLHFFSPANVMRLLEVVRGEKTAKDVVATAMKLARQIAKVPVLSGVCDGFIANRIMSRRGAQADALVLEGPTPQEVDNALTDYGFAMGHFQMMDLVGLDVVGRDATERSVAGDLVAMGRLGQKQNGGYYDYDEARQARPSAVAARVIADVAAERGIAAGGPQTTDEIIARLLYPVVNEGARLLDEGIALRSSDINVAAILGYNWPAHTGGPMFWADSVGLPRIVAALSELRARHGEAFRPSPLLVKLADTGGLFINH